MQPACSGYVISLPVFFQGISFTFSRVSPRPRVECSGRHPRYVLNQLPPPPGIRCGKKASPVTGPILLEKANEYHALLYADSPTCVDATIFKDWFQNHFVPMAKEKLIELGVEPKVLLVMDNCSAHPSEELNADDGSANSHFLTPNVTSLIQPMDQGVLEHLKRIYRKSLLMIYLKRSHFDILLFLIVFYEGDGDARCGCVRGWHYK